MGQARKDHSQLMTPDLEAMLEGTGDLLSKLKWDYTGLHKALRVIALVLT